MNKILQSIGNVFKGGAKAFSLYPASMICAIVVAVATSVLIQSENQNNVHLLQSIQYSFVFGMIFSMALSVWAKKRGAFFPAANIAGLALALILYAILNNFTKEITGITLARIFALTAISFIVFLLIPSSKSKKIDFNQMLFMTLKSFFIALIYYLVIMLGFQFIALAVKTLLYTGMSEKVFTHIAIYSALFGYAFFLGYFPKWGKEEDDEHIDVAIKQPPFIEILLQYIVIPILAILTLVLFIWAVKILITRQLPMFEQLAGIFSGYSLFGILIYILTSHYTSPLVRWYRKILPVAMLVFLAFEGYAIISQIVGFGIKTSEYLFSLIWIFAVASSILFILKPIVKNRLTAYIAIVLIAVSVLPYVGFIDIPVSSQTKRLERALVKNNMLENNKITPSNSLSDDDKEIITDSATFLFRTDDAKFPVWLTKSETIEKDFKQIFGFDQRYDIDIPGNFAQPLNLRLNNSYLNIEGYNYSVNYQDIRDNTPVTVTGKKGNYNVSYNYSDGKIPSLTIEKDGVKVIDIKENNFEDYITSLETKYKNISQTGKNSALSFPADLTYKAEGGGVKIMLVFNFIDVSNQFDNNNKYYYLDLKNIYLGE